MICFSFPPVKIFLQTSALLILVGLASGCAKKTRFESPYAEKPAANLVQTFQDVRRVTEERSPEQELFWARASVKLTQELPKKQKNRFDATLIYGKPNRMRVRGTHFLLGTLFELILDGDDAFVYLTDQKLLFEGSLKEMQENGGLIGSVTPEDLIGAIRVYHRLNDFLNAPKQEGSWATTQAKEYLFVIYKQPERTLVWKVRKADGLVQELLLSNPQQKNRLELQVVYWKYETPEGGEPYPTELEILIPDQKVSLQLEVNEIKLQPNLNPAVITQLPRDIKQRLPMQALGEQAPVLPEDQP